MCLNFKYNKLNYFHILFYFIFYLKIILFKSLNTLKLVNLEVDKLVTYFIFTSINWKQ